MKIFNIHNLLLVMAMICAATVVTTFTSCDWPEDDEQREEVEELAENGLKGTWCVSRTEVSDGDTVKTMAVDNYTEYRQLYMQIIFKKEGDCYVSFNEFVGYDSYTYTPIYRWVRVKGVYSFGDDGVIINSDNLTGSFILNNDGTLYGNVTILKLDDTPVMVYLKKITNCYV